MTKDDYMAYAENLGRHLKSLKIEADKKTESIDGKEGYKQAHHAHSLPACSQDHTQKRNREDPLNNAPASKKYKTGFPENVSATRKRKLDFKPNEAASPTKKAASAKGQSGPYAEAFPVQESLFQNFLYKQNTRGDGNCLFRAILKAVGDPETHHMALRHYCANYVSSNWSSLAVEANLMHQFSPQLPETARSSYHPFPTAKEYADFMKVNGHWGCNLEARAAAIILERPILIWTQETGCHGFLMNFATNTSHKGTIHLLLSRIHFDTLLPLEPTGNTSKTQDLARKVGLTPISTGLAPDMRRNKPPATTSQPATPPATGSPKDAKYAIKTRTLPDLCKNHIKAKPPTPSINHTIKIPIDPTNKTDPLKDSKTSPQPAPTATGSPQEARSAAKIRTLPDLKHQLKKGAVLFQPPAANGLSINSPIKLGDPRLLPRRTTMQTQHKQPGYINKRVLQIPIHTATKQAQTLKRTTTDTDHTTLPATRQSLRLRTKRLQKDNTVNLTSAQLDGPVNKPAATSCQKARIIPFRRPRSVAKYSCLEIKTRKRRKFPGSAPT
jgi:hypothetical protein